MTDHDVAVATPSSDDSQERPDRSIAEQLVDQARADGVDLGGVTGNATCRYKSGSKCTSHWVRISNTYGDATSQTYRRRLVCHETAHVIGITHNTHSSSLNSCVRTPSNTGTDGFSSHEINDMINWQW